MAERSSGPRMKGQSWLIGKSSLGLQTEEKLLWKAHSEEKNKRNASLLFTLLLFRRLDAIY